MHKWMIQFFRCPLWGKDSIFWFVLEKSQGFSVLQPKLGPNFSSQAPKMFQKSQFLRPNFWKKKSFKSLSSLVEVRPNFWKKKKKHSFLDPHFAHHIPTQKNWAPTLLVCFILASFMTYMHTTDRYHFVINDNFWRSEWMNDPNIHFNLSHAMPRSTTTSICLAWLQVYSIHYLTPICRLTEGLIGITWHLYICQ